MQIFCRILFLTYCTLFLANVFALNCENQLDMAKLSFDEIEVNNHAIFDESHPETISVHRFANWLHINTKPYVVKSLLPFDIDGELTKKQLLEAERILNQAAFIRKAKITPKLSCSPKDKNILKVDTWDNWSLMPSISFGRKGGKSKFSVGFKDDNLLGLGISSGIKYSENHLRTSYEIEFDVPINYFRYSHLVTSFSNNSDGNKRYIKFDKPFHHQADNAAYFIDLLKEERIDSIEKNGINAWQFNHKISAVNIGYGKLVDSWDNSLLRMSLGLSKEEHSYSEFVNNSLSDFSPNEWSTYPWLAVEYIQDNYKTLNNVKLINHREDINFGWQIKMKFGFDIDNQYQDDTLGIHLASAVEKAFQQKNFFTFFKFKAKSYLIEDQKDRFLISGEVSTLHQLNDRWSSYYFTQIVASKNQAIYQPTALGGDNGVRGYPIQYQHGDNYWSASTELRYNPNQTLYQVVNVAWASFIDIGRTWGDTHTDNINTKTLSSIGIGARLFSSHSSEKNVVHVDLIKPLVKGEHINSWEWRVQVKHRL